MGEDVDSELPVGSDDVSLVNGEVDRSCIVPQLLLLYNFGPWSIVESLPRST